MNMSILEQSKRVESVIKDLDLPEHLVGCVMRSCNQPYIMCAYIDMMYALAWDSKLICQLKEGPELNKAVEAEIMRGLKELETLIADIIKKLGGK